MKITELKKYGRYKIPGCENIFVFNGFWSMNRNCFTRQDGERHYGREFLEFENGNYYLDLIEVTNDML
jgi:hypothetical protein